MAFWGKSGFRPASVSTLRSRQMATDGIFKCNFLNENAWILIKMSLKAVPKGRINNIPALFQIMAWHRPGAKPLSESIMVRLPTHICVTRPQWVNVSRYFIFIHPGRNKWHKVHIKRLNDKRGWGEYASEASWRYTHVRTCIITAENIYVWYKTGEKWIENKYQYTGRIGHIEYFLCHELGIMNY